MFIGLDFGTNSVRGVVYDTSIGDITTSSSSPYETLDLEDNSCLFSDPDVWVAAGRKVLKELTRKNNIIQGIGIAFTACTILPILENGDPLSKAHPDQNPSTRPHLYAKMWKHHSSYSQKVSSEITQLLNDNNQTWLQEVYGGTISLEWSHSKIIEVYDLDRHAFNETFCFVDAGDWVVWNFLGRPLPLEKHFKRSTQHAAFKSCFVDGKQLLSNHLLTMLRPNMTKDDANKINSHDWFEMISPGTSVGIMNDDEIKLKIPISASAIDAHACALALGAFDIDRFVMVCGTSGCFMMNTKYNPCSLRGVAGSIPDGIIKGCQGLEFGQAACGDCFAWLSKFTTIPVAKLEKAAINLLEKLLNEKRTLECFAIDYFNGCRTPLMRGDLTGSLFGLTLATSPSHVYLALMEALCFGIKVVVEMLKSSKIPISQYILAGGMSASELFQKCLSTVLDEEIIVFKDGAEATCRGAAVYASLMSRDSSKIVAPTSYTLVQPLSEWKHVFLNDSKFQRYLKLTGVSSFL